MKFPTSLLLIYALCINLLIWQVNAHTNIYTCTYTYAYVWWYCLWLHQSLQPLASPSNHSQFHLFHTHSTCILTILSCLCEHLSGTTEGSWMATQVKTRTIFFYKSPGHQWEVRSPDPPLHPCSAGPLLCILLQSPQLLRVCNYNRW